MNSSHILRDLGPSEVVQAGHLVLWSQSPRDAWTTVNHGSPYVGLPVETLRHRHGQPGLRFGILASPCLDPLSRLLELAQSHLPQHLPDNSAHSEYKRADMLANAPIYPGQSEDAAKAALRSLAYSIGILHADYKTGFGLSGLSGPVRLVS